MAAPLQYVLFETAFTVGVGCTVMLNTIGLPVHPLAEGVTVMVATTVATPVLVAVNDGISPLPLAARPIDGVSLIHAKWVPLTGPLKEMLAVAAPLQ